MDKEIRYTDLIGAPFKNKGRDYKTGIDCYGLVMEVHKRYGVTIPEYTAEFDNMEKINKIYTGDVVGSGLWEKVNLEYLTPPCLLAIRFGAPPGIVNHAGCYIGNGRFIHIRENIGVCVEKIDSPAWRKVIVGFYKYKGAK